jgi:hypothetical protein
LAIIKKSLVLQKLLLVKKGKGPESSALAAENTEWHMMDRLT